MKTILISAAAIMAAAGFAASAHAQGGAHLNDPAQWQREHNRAVAAGDWANDPYDSRSSDDLNRRSLDQARAAGSGIHTYVVDNGDNGYDGYAPMTADTGVNYSSDQNYSSDDDDTTTVTVVGPAHEAYETAPQPDTNPQSTGTPSIDTPYAVPPSTYVPPDEDSSGMYQPH